MLFNVIVISLSLLVVICYFAKGGSDGIDAASSEELSAAYEKLVDGQGDDYLISSVLFSTVDGRLHAFDPNLQLKWSVSLGDTLVSSYNYHVKSPPPVPAQSSGKSKRIISSSDEYSIIPALDGSLIFHSPVTGFRKTSMKVDNLQQKTPFLSIDNELLFSGNKVTKIFGIDSITGIVITEDGRSVNRDPAIHGIHSFDNRKILWVGRVDYIVSAMDGTSGYERFNVTYSEIKPLYSRRFNGKSRGGHGGGGDGGVPDDGLAGEDGDDDSIGSNDDFDMSDSNFFLVGSLSLITTPDGDVYFSNFHTNEVRKISLGSTVTTAHKLIRRIDMKPHENENVIPMEISHKIPQKKYHSDKSNNLLDGGIESSSFDDDQGASLPVVVVQGHSGGGIYAVEVDRNDGGNGKKNHLKNFYFFGDDEVDNDYDEERRLSIPWAGKIAYKPIDNLTSTNMTNNSDTVNIEGDASNGNNVAQCLLALGQYDDEDDEKFIKDNEGWASYYNNNDNLQICLLGKHFMDDKSNINNNNSNNSKTDTSDGSSSGAVYSNNYLLKGDDIELPSFLLPPVVISSNPASNKADLVQDDVIKVVNTTIIVPNNRGYDESYFIIAVLTLLIFGLSYFYIVKPYFATDKNADLIEKIDVSPNASSSPLPVPAVASTIDNALSPQAPQLPVEVVVKTERYGTLLQVGDLLICNIVLGIGSLGTTVFLGYIKNSNRVCAVKKMVGYGGSQAEREINLMSKLDDHSNVLRYYQCELVRNGASKVALSEKPQTSGFNSNLKFGIEDHGTVVYLAIQLCVMTLKDFILNVKNNIRKKDNLKTITQGENSALNVEDNRIQLDDSIRDAIRQILCGLLHLHSNKVVHRDLKPHNILLTFNDSILSKTVKKVGRTGGGSKSDADVDMSKVVYPSLDPWIDLFTKTGGSTSSDAVDAEDLNPFNNLVLNEYSNIDKFQVKIADMGLSKEWWNEDNDHSQGNSFGNSHAQSHSMNYDSFSLWDNLRNKETREFTKDLKESVIGNEYKLNDGIVGTIGWQAPEIIVRRRKREQEGGKGSPHQTTAFEPSTASSSVSAESGVNANSSLSNSKSADLFSLGLVLYYILVPGCHAFGQWKQREDNIVEIYGNGAPPEKTKSKTAIGQSIDSININYGINDSISYNSALDEKLKILQSPGLLKNLTNSNSRRFLSSSRNGDSSDNQFPDNNSKGKPASSDAYYFYPEEAFSLIRRLLDPLPQNRLQSDLLYHPLFFNSMQRLTLLEEVSDWIERVVYSGQAQINNQVALSASSSDASGESKNLSMPVADVLQLLESRSQVIIQSIWSDSGSSYSFNSTNSVGWDVYLDPLLLQDANRYRKYDYFLIRDLLRFIRNKKHHYYDLPVEIRESLAPPEKFISYFETRFPRLLYHCYSVCLYIDKLKSKYYPYVSTSKVEETVLNNADAKVVDSTSLSGNVVSAGNDGGLPSVFSGETRGWYPAADAWVDFNIINPTNGALGSASSKNTKNKRCSTGHLLKACMEPKYRTRICTNWETSLQTPPYIGECSRKKKGCDFAHGCIELRKPWPSRLGSGLLGDSGSVGPQSGGGGGGYSMGVGMNMSMSNPGANSSGGSGYAVGSSYPGVHSANVAGPFVSGFSANNYIYDNSFASMSINNSGSNSSTSSSFANSNSNSNSKSVLGATPARYRNVGDIPEFVPKSKSAPGPAPGP